MATVTNNKKFSWQLDVETKLNACVGSHDPKKFQAATLYLLQEANMEVGLCIAEKKFKCAKRLYHVLKVFLAHIHLKRKFMIAEVSHPSIYDVTLAILSLLLDLQLILSRKPKNSSITEEIHNQIVEDILLFAGSGTEYLWDVLLQSSELKKKRFRNIGGPVLERIIGASPWKRVQEPEAFLKCLLCLRLWHINCVPAERSKVQRITLSLPVPRKLASWLRAHPMDGLPLLAKKENPKTFLQTFLKQVEQSVADELCGALSEELTAPESDETCEPEGSIADILKDPFAVDTAAKELFVLDTSGSKDPLITSDLEDQDTDDLLQQIQVDLEGVSKVPEHKRSSKRKLTPNLDDVLLLSEDEQGFADLQEPSSNFVSIEQTPEDEHSQLADEVERPENNLQDNSKKSKKSRKKRKVANKLDEASAVSENILEGDELVSGETCLLAAKMLKKNSADNIEKHQKASFGTEVTKSKIKKVKTKKSIKKKLSMDLDEKLPLSPVKQADFEESSEEFAPNLEPANDEENNSQIGDSNNNLSPMKSNLHNFHDYVTSDSDNGRVKNMDSLDTPLDSDDDENFKISNIDIPTDMEIEECKKPFESPLKETKKLVVEKNDKGLESEVDLEKDNDLPKESRTIQTSPKKTNLKIVDKTETSSPRTKPSQIFDPATDFQSQYSNFLNAPTQLFVPSRICNTDVEQISSENSNLDLEEIAVDVSCQTNLTSDEDAEKVTLISLSPAEVEKKIKKKCDGTDLTSDEDAEKETPISLSPALVEKNIKKEWLKETDLSSDEDEEKENPVPIRPSQVELEKEEFEKEDSNAELNDTEISPNNASQELFVSQQEEARNKTSYVESDSSEEFLSPDTSPEPSPIKLFKVKSPLIENNESFHQREIRNSQSPSPSKFASSQRPSGKTPTKNCTPAFGNVSVEKTDSSPNDTTSYSVSNISKNPVLCSEGDSSPKKCNSPKKSNALCKESGDCTGNNIPETEDMDVQITNIDTFPDVQKNSTEVEEFSQCSKSDFPPIKSNSSSKDSNKCTGNNILESGDVDIQSMDIDVAPEVDENRMEVDTISREDDDCSEVAVLNMKDPETPRRRRTVNASPVVGNAASQKKMRLRSRKFCTSDESIVEQLDGSEVSDTLISESDSPLLIGNTTPTRDSISELSTTLENKLYSPRQNCKERSVDIGDECVSLDIPNKSKKLSPIKTPTKSLDNAETLVQSAKSFNKRSPTIVLENITVQNADATTDKLQSPLKIQEDSDNIPKPYSLRTRKRDSTPEKKLQELKKSSASVTSLTPSKTSDKIKEQKCKSPLRIEKPDQTSDKNGLSGESTTHQFINETTTPTQQLQISPVCENLNSPQKNRAIRSGNNDSSDTSDNDEHRYNTKKLSPMKLSPAKNSDNEIHYNTRNRSPMKSSPTKSSDNESHSNTKNLSPRKPSAKSSDNESHDTTRNLSPMKSSPMKSSPAKSSDNESPYIIKNLSPMKPFPLESSDSTPYYNTRTKSPIKPSLENKDSSVVPLQHGSHNPVRINDHISSPVKRSLEIKSMQSINNQADLYLGNIQDPIKESPLKMIKELKSSKLIPSVRLVAVKEIVFTRLQTRTDPVAKIPSSPNPAKGKGETLTGQKSKALSCHNEVSLHVPETDDVSVSSTETLLNFSLQKSNIKSHAETNLKSDMLSESKDSLSSSKSVGSEHVKSNSEVPTKSLSKKMSYTDDSNSELSDTVSESSVSSSESYSSSSSSQTKQTFSSSKKNVTSKASKSRKPIRNAISETTFSSDSDETNTLSQKGKQTSPTLERTILTDESNSSSTLLADQVLSTPTTQASARITPVKTLAKITPTSDASVQTVLRSRHIAMLTPPISSRRILRNRTVSRVTTVQKSKAKAIPETPQSSKTLKARSLQSKTKPEVGPSSRKDSPSSSPVAGPSEVVSTPSSPRMSPRRSKLYAFRPRVKTPKV